MSQEPRPAPRGLKSILSQRPALLALPALLIAGVIVLVLIFSGGGGSSSANNNASDLEHAGLQTPVPEATIDPASLPPTAAPDADINPTAVSEGDRLIIAKFGVNAPLTLKTVGLDGVMPNPNGPDDIALYNFSAWPGKGGTPGKGGNAIFAGHVDSGSKACKNGTVPPPCEAVLWDLNRLKPGDEIQVQYGGQLVNYKVTSNQAVNAVSAPWDQIVSSTAQESLTIITCGGDFNRETHEYNSRQVLTAVRA